MLLLTQSHPVVVFSFPLAKKSKIKNNHHHDENSPRKLTVVVVVVVVASDRRLTRRCSLRRVAHSVVLLTRSVTGSPKNQKSKTTTTMTSRVSGSPCNKRHFHGEEKHHRRHNKHTTRMAAPIVSFDGWKKLVGPFSAKIPSGDHVLVVSSDFIAIVVSNRLEFFPLFSR